jgi:uncharacterized protein YhfF
MTQPVPDPEVLEAFVAGFRAATGHRGPLGRFAFDDTPAEQTALGLLVLEGPKRATAGLHAGGGAAGDPTAVVGQHDVVLDGAGTPLCVVRTEEVRTVPFAERDPAFAWDEGEGDRSLRHWTDVHVGYLTRSAADRGETFGETTLVDLERFVVVHPEPDTFGAALRVDGEVQVRSVTPAERAWVRTMAPDVRSEEGWSVDRCPALVARHRGRTAGVLVFVPDREATEVVVTVVLDDAPGVGSSLEQALGALAREHGWGPVED